MVVYIHYFYSVNKILLLKNWTRLVIFLIWNYKKYTYSLYLLGKFEKGILILLVMRYTNYEIGFSSLSAFMASITLLKNRAWASSIVIVTEFVLLETSWVSGCSIVAVKSLQIRPKRTIFRLSSLIRHQLCIVDSPSFKNHAQEGSSSTLSQYLIALRVCGDLHLLVTNSVVDLTHSRIISIRQSPQFHDSKNTLSIGFSWGIHIFHGGLFGKSKSFTIQSLMSIFY